MGKKKALFFGNKGVSLPTAYLVTYFKLNGNTNDATGTVTPTSTGITYVNNIYDGSSNGSSNWSSNSDNIIVSDNNVYTFSDGTTDNPFTIHGSIKFTNLGVSEGGFYNKFICHKRAVLGSPTTEREWQIITSDSQTSPRMQLYVFDAVNGGSKKITGSTILVNNTNYFFKISYDGVNYSIKLNGNEETLTITTSGTYVSMKNTISQFKVGSNSWDSLYGFQGDLNTLGIWNGVALTDEQEEYLRDIETNGNYIL